jgi:quercetin dioxygenase-like cupin family protein
MQVRGADAVTLTPGQTFYEGPNDVHVVGRNVSQTAPAKFLVLGQGQGRPNSCPREVTCSVVTREVDGIAVAR